MALIETARPLSASRLWPLLAEYYRGRGPGAWLPGGVPFQATSNAAMARCYARLIQQFLLDQKPEELATIVELGAGHGRLGLLVLEELQRLQASSPLGVPPFRLVLSDLSPACIADWRSRPELQPHFDSGRLDVALYSCDARALQLEVSGLTLDSEHICGTLVLLANYFFDSLPLDLFMVEESTLHACLVELHGESAGSELAALRPVFKLEPLGEPAYNEPSWNALLEGYLQSLRKGCVGLPVTAFQILPWWQQLARESCLLLVADKGPLDLAAHEGRALPPFITHQSFSYPVNFHALGQWIAAEGGDFRLCSRRPGSLQLGMFLLRGKLDSCPRLLQGWQEGPETFSPTDFAVLRRATLRGGFELDSFLALMRLAADDAELFWQHSQALLNKAPSVPRHNRRAVLQLLQRVAQRRLVAPPPVELWTRLGRIAAALRCFAQAADWLRAACAGGAEAAVLLELGACLLRTDGARDWWAEARASLQMAGLVAEAEQQEQHDDAWHALRSGCNLLRSKLAALPSEAVVERNALAACWQRARDADPGLAALRRAPAFTSLFQPDPFHREDIRP